MLEPDEVRAVEGNPLRARGDGLLQPIPCRDPRSAGWLEGCFEAAGSSVVESLEEQLPLRIGSVAATSGGDLPFERIVHLPVQSAPGSPTTEKNLRVALRSGLVAVDRADVGVVVLPRLIPPDQRASMDVDAVLETLLEDLLQYPPAHFSGVRIVDADPDWLERVRGVLRGG